MTFDSGPNGRPSTPEWRRSNARSGRSNASVTLTDHFDAILDPNTDSGVRRRTKPLSERTKWIILLVITACHPALLLALYPIVGDAINTIVLAGPVAATLLLGIRVGVLSILLNTAVSGFVFWYLTGMSLDQGWPKALVSVLVTITVCWGADRLRHFIEQRRAMEVALRQAQKIEAIGRLAAGVAHDINNTLNAIMGSTFALRHELATYGRSFQDLDNIALACDRGAQLTRNLLGFARKSCARCEPFSLNGVAREVQALLTRTIHKNVRIETRFAEPAPLMTGDEAQVEHAVMNLCLNALDAMDDRGTLTIATANEGQNVSISVSDTGTGMDDHVREHAFEPFFTTKPVGKGTGMGLSMVYGTVQVMHGTIALTTKLGVGTTITLSFPRTAEPTPVTSESPTSMTSMTEPCSLAGLTILVVDDDALVLRAAVRMLRAMRCEVLSASNGREGIETFRAHRGSISLAIIDLVMPDMDGVATMDEILALAPETPILLASGYTPTSDKLEGLLVNRPTVAYLSKPYDPNAIRIETAKVVASGAAMVRTSSRTGTA